MTISLLFSLATYLVDALPLFGSGVTGHLAAWNYFGPMDKAGYGISKQMWQVMYYNFFPLISILAYADFYHDDRQTGMLKSVLSRCSRFSYYTAGLLTVFLGGFLVFFIPLLINQILWLFTVPAFSMIDPLSDNAIPFMMFPDLYSLHPYINNIVYMCLPGIMGGLIAQLSSTISLFFSKRKFLFLAIPYIAYVFICFVSGLIDIGLIDLQAYMQPVSPVSNNPFWFLLLLFFLLITGTTVTAFSKIKRIRDEL